MGSLAATIPGLQKHRTQVRAPQFCPNEAKRHSDQVFFWMKDNLPEDLLAWLRANNTEQFNRVMNASKQIDICAQNQDMPGVKTACSDMVRAMQLGLRLYNQTPVPDVAVKAHEKLF